MSVGPLHQTIPGFSVFNDLVQISQFLLLEEAKTKKLFFKKQKLRNSSSRSKN
jgi:hypothetical protein